MKRSEVLKIIEDSFRAHAEMCAMWELVDEKGEPDGREHKVEAEILLQILESIGMQPPKIENMKILPDSSGYLSLDAALNIGLHRWEPE
jgi:hypothetical protein